MILKQHSMTGYEIIDKRNSLVAVDSSVLHRDRGLAWYTPGLGCP